MSFATLEEAVLIVVAWLLINTFAWSALISIAELSAGLVGLGGGVVVLFLQFLMTTFGIRRVSGESEMESDWLLVDGLGCRRDGLINEFIGANKVLLDDAIMLVDAFIVGGILNDPVPEKLDEEEIEEGVIIRGNCVVDDGNAGLVSITSVTLILAKPKSGRL